MRTKKTKSKAKKNTSGRKKAPHGPRRPQEENIPGEACCEALTHDEFEESRDRALLPEESAALENGNSYHG